MGLAAYEMFSILPCSVLPALWPSRDCDLLTELGPASLRSVISPGSKKWAVRFGAQISWTSLALVTSRASYVDLPFSLGGGSLLRGLPTSGYVLEAPERL